MKYLPLLALSLLGCKRFDQAITIAHQTEVKEVLEFCETRHPASFRMKACVVSVMECIDNDPQSFLDAKIDVCFHKYQ